MSCYATAQVVASSLDTLQPVILENFDSKEDLLTCLKASANVPRIAGDPIELRYFLFSLALITSSSCTESAPSDMLSPGPVAKGEALTGVCVCVHAGARGL